MEHSFGFFGDRVSFSPHTEQGNDMHNLNLAFEVAEKHLDIPKMLDAEGNIYRQKWWLCTIRKDIFENERVYLLNGVLFI